MKVYLLATLTLALLVSSCQTSQSIRMYPVKENSFYGYIDDTGSATVLPQFQYASNFSEGYALVVIDDSSLAFLDYHGKTLPIPAEIRPVDLPSEGLARAVQDGKVGYLKIPQLNWQIPPTWEAGGRFSQGLASVLLPEGKAGYINTKGELVFTLQASALGDFSQHRAWFVRGGRFGLINRSGTELVAPQYSWLGDFHQGLARARTVDGLYGYLGLNGKWRIPPRFSRAEDFSEGKALVYHKQSQRYGYIDSSGKISIAPIFLDGGNFHNGRAWVKLGETFHYINDRGQQIAEIQLLDAGNFFGPLAEARDENGSLYLNRDNRIIWHSSSPSSTAEQSSATT